MGELKISNKEVVVPGETLAEGMDFLPSYGTYRSGEKILAGRLGLAITEGKVIKLVSLTGSYLPKRGDTIIGKVTEIMLSGWRININSAYSAVLSLQEGSSHYIEKGSDLKRIYNFGEYIVVKVTQVTTQRLIDVSARGPGLRKLVGGRIIKVGSHKVPRIIGKKGSMVSLIKDYTKCKIIVGQNGVVWIQGNNPEDEILTVNTIRKIEREAHISGLTDNIKKHLEAQRPIQKIDQTEVKER